MNTKILAVTFGLVFVFCINIVLAQNSYQIGGLPSFNINSKLKKDWSLNAKIESRQLFKSGNFDGDVYKRNTYILTDYSLILAKKVGLNSRIAGGYLLRVGADGELFHRFMQQYIVLQKISGFRVSHRFLTDQTFSKNENPTLRARYRITSEIPLNGEAVDAREFYFKINNEYLNSWQESEYDLEIRLVSVLGYDLTSRSRMEAGLDYRINQFVTQNKTRHSFWLALNFFVEI